MRIFLDTADTEVIRKYFSTGLVDGVTTNPSLILKSGRNPEDVYQEIKDIGGNSHDPKQYVQSHLKGDDTAKTSRLLADEWKIIRTERDRLLTSTDWWGASDQTMSDAQTAYRVALRTLPADQSSKTTYASITWPTKPKKNE